MLGLEPDLQSGICREPDLQGGEDDLGLKVYGVLRVTSGVAQLSGGTWLHS